MDLGQSPSGAGHHAADASASAAGRAPATARPPAAATRDASRARAATARRATRAARCRSSAALPKRGFRPIARTSTSSSTSGSSRRSPPAARSAPTSCARAASCRSAALVKCLGDGRARRTRSRCGRTPSATAARERDHRRGRRRSRCSVLEGFSNAPRIPELRKRLVFTAGGARDLPARRATCPTPGIDGQALDAVLRPRRATTSSAWCNMFSGGALERFSIFALGIMPYISASIILQLLTVVIPYLEKLSKEGELGRRKITQYTRYGTVVLALVQGFFIAVGLETIEAPGGASVVFEPGLGLPAS